MIVALHSVLRQGHEQEYDSDHERLPDDLVASFRRLGIRDWSIWRAGRDLFHLVDCDDFEAAMASLADDPADHAWQAHIGRHVDHFTQIGGSMILPRVYSFAEQVAGT